MGPLSNIWNEMNKTHDDNTSRMEIEEIAHLMKEKYLMIGQVNIECLYERRQNFLAKILKSIKKAKSMLRESET
jgi:hypothetical protein